MTIVPDQNAPAATNANPHTSEAAKARIRARNRADGRLKLYGRIAIAFAAFALVALLYNVFVRAGAVLTEHYIEVPLVIEAEEDDFLSLQKSAMKEAFPAVTGRKERRALYDLVSDGAADDMRAEAAVGTLERGPVTRQFLASDNVDLYLRGEFGTLRQVPANGSLTLTDGGKQIALSSDAADFSPAIAAVKEAMRGQVTALAQKAERQKSGASVLTERLETLTGKERERAERQLKSANAKYEKMLAQMARLETQIDGPVTEQLKLNTKMPSFLVRAQGGILKLTAVSETGASAIPLVPLTGFDAAPAGDWSLEVMDAPETSRTVSDLQIGLVEQLRAEGRISKEWNWRFLRSGDSTQPEIAGIKAALYGSFLTLAITFVLAFPVAVLAAIYLEEFARKNRFTDFIEVNINNLAAVPSIVFGLLGLAVLTFAIQSLQLNITRGAPLIGGFVLALMTLPTIIIASRAAIRAVPPSIRSAALGLGASKEQTVFHHVLPLAMPGILTGTIIGMAQALGETAPLLLIGMVAFITAAPDCLSATNCLTEQPATVLPVQVFQWAGLSERAFDARTAAAIVVLLIFLVLMNALAIILRKRFERRW